MSLSTTIAARPGGALSAEQKAQISALIADWELPTTIERDKFESVLANILESYIQRSKEPIRGGDAQWRKSYRRLSKRMKILADQIVGPDSIGVDIDGGPTWRSDLVELHGRLIDMAETLSSEAMARKGRPSDMPEVYDLVQRAALPFTQATERAVKRPNMRSSGARRLPAGSFARFCSDLLEIANGSAVVTVTDIDDAIRSLLRA
jgi:hypothetical protein